MAVIGLTKPRAAASSMQRLYTIPDRRHSFVGLVPPEGLHGRFDAPLLLEKLQGMLGGIVGVCLAIVGVRVRLTVRPGPTPGMCSPCCTNVVFKYDAVEFGAQTPVVIIMQPIKKDAAAALAEVGG
jgi:hypothetical protein